MKITIPPASPRGEPASVYLYPRLIERLDRMKEHENMRSRSAVIVLLLEHALDQWESERLSKRTP